MKAITIKQPWASAIMAGVKRVENRTWGTSRRGPIAIHAGRSVDPRAEEILRSAGIDTEQFRDAPRGVVLGTVDLVDVVSIDTVPGFTVPGFTVPGFTVPGFTVPALPGFADELADDPLATGPVCWVLENPRPLAEPIPCRGNQGFFHVDLP